MNKIIWKFFGAFVFITLIVVSVLYFFVSWKLQDNFEEKITTELQSNAVLVGDILSGDLLEQKNGNIQRKIEALAEKLDLRITVVDEQVIVDPAQVAEGVQLRPGDADYAPVPVRDDLDPLLGAGGEDGQAVPDIEDEQGTLVQVVPDVVQRL